MPASTVCIPTSSKCRMEVIYRHACVRLDVATWDILASSTNLCYLRARPHADQNEETIIQRCNKKAARRRSQLAPSSMRRALHPPAKQASKQAGGWAGGQARWPHLTSMYDVRYLPYATSPRATQSRLKTKTPRQTKIKSANQIIDRRAVPTNPSESSSPSSACMFLHHLPLNTLHPPIRVHLPITLFTFILQPIGRPAVPITI